MVNDILADIKGIKRAIAKSKNFVEIPTLKTIEGCMKQRIHNEGKAANNTRIGDYKSKGHIKKRRGRGRQVAKVDLQLEGDLIRSYTVGKRNTNNVLGFKTDAARIIATGNEEQRNKVIFSPSDKEVDKGLKVYDKQITKIFKRNAR